MTDLPEPLTPADCDLQDFPFMPLHVARLRDSDLAAAESPEACWYAVLLWAASWHQVPAASLPDDDLVLTRLCGLGRDVKTFRKHRSGALRGFIKCSDGRLYHPVVAEQANTSMGKRDAYRERKEKRRAAGSLGGQAKWANTKSSDTTRSERLAAARQLGTHTSDEWNALVRACGSKCVRCGSSGPVVKDHIKPVYQGGADSIDNLQPLCQPCNSSKGPESTDFRPGNWQRLVSGYGDGLAMLDRTPSNASDERLPKGTGTGTGTGTPPNPHSTHDLPRFAGQRPAVRAVLEAARFVAVPPDTGLVDEWLALPNMKLERDILPLVEKITGEAMATTGRAPFRLKFFDSRIREQQAADEAEIARLQRIAARAERQDEAQRVAQA